MTTTRTNRKTYQPQSPAPKQEEQDPEQTCVWDVRLHSDGLYRFTNIRPLHPKEKQG